MTKKEIKTLVLIGLGLIMSVLMTGCGCSKETEVAEAPVVEKQEPVNTQVEETPTVVEEEPTVAPEPDLFTEPLYVLLLGTDGRPGQTSFRSDAIVIARIDTQEKKIAMVSIPRDTRVQIEGRGFNKINASYAFGGPDLAVSTVEEFSGIKIDRYVSMGFEEFKAAANLVGGIEVDVSDRIDDDKVATYVIQKGTQTLNGTQLLAYARSRKFPDGDYSRTRHQREILRAFIGNYIATNTKLAETEQAVAEHAVTNLTAEEIRYLWKKLNGIEAGDITTGFVPSNSKNIDGVSYVVHHEEAWREMVEKFSSGQTDWSND